MVPSAVFIIYLLRQTRTEFIDSFTPTDLEMNCKRSRNKICHFVLNMLPRYRAKFENSAV